MKAHSSSPVLFLHWSLESGGHGGTQMRGQWGSKGQEQGLKLSKNILHMCTKNTLHLKTMFGLIVLSV